MPKTGEIGASAEIKYFRLFGVLNIQDSISHNLSMVGTPQNRNFFKERVFCSFSDFLEFFRFFRQK